MGQAVTRVALAEIENAIARGVRFLERSQLPSGELRIYCTRDRSMATECVADPSVYPTALAADVLASTPSAAKVRDRAIDFLLAEMDAHGLWRHWTHEHPYHQQLPPDLDDTAVASAAITKAGRPMPDNRPLLLANRDPRLFYTWVVPRLHRATAAHWRVTLPQLRHPLVMYFFFRRTSAAPHDVDAVVNANVLSYLGISDATRPIIELLLRVLREDREATCDKWYDDPFVVWYFFSRALHAAAPEAGELIANKLAATTPRNRLQIALAASASLYWKRDADLAPLLAAQEESGAWPRAAIYHGGRERLRDGSYAPQHPDTPHWGSEELTTAFAIEALTLAQQAHESRR